MLATRVRYTNWHVRLAQFMCCDGLLLLLLRTAIYVFGGDPGSFRLRSAGLNLIHAHAQPLACVRQRWKPVSFLTGWGTR